MGYAALTHPTFNPAYLLINSDGVIACIDDFCQSRTKPTIIAMDQASIHTSQKIEKKRLE